MPTYLSSVGESGCIQSNKRSQVRNLLWAPIAENECYKLRLHTCNSAQAGLLQGSWDDPRSLEQGDHAPKTVFLCILSMRACATLVVLKGLNEATCKTNIFSPFTPMTSHYIDGANVRHCLCNEIEVVMR